jgi:hypothetical protein
MVKIGDKVRIIDNRSGHRFKIGTIVILNDIDEFDDYFSGREEGKPKSTAWCFGRREFELAQAKNNREASFSLEKEYY